MRASVTPDGLRGRMLRVVAGTRALAERLDAVQPRSWVLLGISFYLMAAAVVVAKHDFNATVLIRFGHYYAEQNPEHTPTGALVFVGDERHGGNGYDGQIFYYYARTLFLPGVWPRGFNAAYRAPRVGYPLLVAPFAIFGNWGAVFGMLFVQALLFAAGAWAFYRLLPPDRRVLLAFYLCSPFALQSALVAVSDSIMISLQMLGLYFFVGRRSPFADEEPGIVKPPQGGQATNLLFAFLFFSLAVVTKESSLFLLFPLGLWVLLHRDWPRVAIMLAVLAPMVLWQVYLRAAHGMVPAGVLGVFLSPFSGVIGLLNEAGASVLALFAQPGVAAVAKLAKLTARLLLLALIGLVFFSLATGRPRRVLPFRAAVVFALASVLIADHYYFWGVYENISRMFTPLVPVLLLLAAQDRRSKMAPALLVLAVLALLVLLRTTLLTPVFPFEVHEQYRGPDHRHHAPLPGSLHRRASSP